MAINAKLVSLLILSAALATWSGCSGDGSTLGPDGTTTADDDNGDTNGDDVDANGDDVDANGDNGDTDGDSGPTVTLTQLKTDVFTARCGAPGCHLSPSPPNNMSLAPDLIWQEIFDVAALSDSNFKRIAPGDPDNSYIIMKLRGDSRIVGSQMPLDGGGPIPDEDIARIATWIEEGALDN